MSLKRQSRKSLIHKRSIDCAYADIIPYALAHIYKVVVGAITIAKLWVVSDQLIIIATKHNRACVQMPPTEKGENMNRELEEHKQYIRDTLHRIIVIARFITEESNTTEEDVKAFISEVGNKEFEKVFRATEQEFMMIAMGDLLKDSATLAEMMKGEE